MPKVHDIGDWRVTIYPNDHRPAHVHVIGGGGEAVFILNCPDGPPMLRESFGFKKSELSRIETGLAKVLTHLCAKWSEQHGGY